MEGNVIDSECDKFWTKAEWCKRCENGTLDREEILIMAWHSQIHKLFDMNKIV
jgi:hypothetical protein